MRIVGGKYKGRTLNDFKGQDIRPTSDMARESLFNILRFDIVGADFLDLFSGTGAVGIEALSRGANSVTFNDFSRKSVALVKTNLEKLKVDEQYSVVNYDAVSFLSSGQKKYDIIYIDPPYKTDLKEKCLSVAKNSLKQNGIVILEDENKWEMQIPDLVKYDERKYGRVHLTFFKGRD